MTADTAQFEKIKSLAEKVKRDNSNRDIMYRDILQMYHMEDDPKVNRARRDRDDVKLTLSPSARDAVIGMVRLLTTSEPHFAVKSKTGKKNDEIEELCKRMWAQSSMVKRAKIHIDLARSAVLFADAHLSYDAVDDLLAVKNIPDYEKRRLEDIRKRTPFLFEAVNPRDGYPVWGRHGLIGYLKVYELTGEEVRERFGEQDVKEETLYTVNDWYGVEWRCVWLNEKSAPLFMDKHELPSIPVSVQVADGTTLFREPEYIRQPFLYGKWKSELWKRENLILTSLFTSIAERGTGPLIGFDEVPDEVNVNFAGTVRYITAPNPKMLNDKAFDADLLAAKERIIDPISNDTTIYKQTLGQGMGNTPFSSLAMLSQSGRLPLVSPSDAVATTICNAMLDVLRRIKRDGMKNLGDDLNASDIPDDIELEVTLEVKLPQDQFRNAQIAAQLQNMVSKEWIHTNLLQINNSNEMTEAIWREQMEDILYKTMAEGQVEQFKQLMVQMQKPPTPPSKPMPPQGMPPMPAAGEGQAMIPGGAAAAQAGGGANPMTEPVMPEGM
jgi:hypothetical protein